MSKPGIKISVVLTGAAVGLAVTVPPVGIPALFGSLMAWYTAAKNIKEPWGLGLCVVSWLIADTIYELLIGA